MVPPTTKRRRVNLIYATLCYIINSEPVQNSMQDITPQSQERTGTAGEAKITPLRSLGEVLFQPLLTQDKTHQTSMLSVHVEPSLALGATLGS